MTTPRTFSLPPRQTLRLRRSGALVLQVMQGRLWVTRSRDDADHFVTAGQALHLAAGSDVVIECDSPQPARLQLLDAGPRTRRSTPQSAAWPTRTQP